MAPAPFLVPRTERARVYAAGRPPATGKPAHAPVALGADICHNRSHSHILEGTHEDL